MRKMTWAILVAVVVLLASPMSGYGGRKNVYVGSHVRVGHPAWRGHGLGIFLALSSFLRYGSRSTPHDGGAACRAGLPYAN
jgi:hypothetical protein